MKCRICKKHMTDIYLDFDYEHNSLTKKAVNVMTLYAVIEVVR